jgi:hypothetical protein
MIAAHFACLPMTIKRSRLPSASALRARDFIKSLRVTMPTTFFGSSGDTTGSRPTPAYAMRSAAVRHDSHG